MCPNLAGQRSERNLRTTQIQLEGENAPLNPSRTKKSSHIIKLINRRDYYSVKSVLLVRGVRPTRRCSFTGGVVVCDPIIRGSCKRLLFYSSAFLLFLIFEHYVRNTDGFGR